MGNCCGKAVLVTDPDGVAESGASVKSGIFGIRGASYKSGLINVSVSGNSKLSAGGIKAGQDGSGSLSAEVEAINSSSAVKVTVVVRPLLAFEREKSTTDIVTIQPPSKVRLAGTGAGDYDGQSFEYDRVYRVEQAAVAGKLFAECVVPVLQKFCQGFNATVLAYGQTGAGKTHTMGLSMKAADGHGQQLRGVVPQSLQHIFDHMAQASAKYDIKLKASFYEIYNEEIRDLLQHLPRRPGTANNSRPSTPGAPGGGSTGVTLREGANGEVVLEGVREVTVASRADVAALLEEGNNNRAVASHKMNDTSSRSHAILTLVLEQRVQATAASSVPQQLRFLRSKMHLVDLAGSERAKETGTTGQRFAEGVNINKGLLELGNVITALTQPGTRHVPYRNSRLTRVLQDSLGGSGETLMVACISPAESNREHSLGTLRYAARARAIKNQLRLNNEVSAAEELAYLRRMVAEQQQEIDALKERLRVGNVAVGAAKR